jgi:hypothetical protein
VLRRALGNRLPKQHQALLSTLLDNVEKDYRTHQKEIYTKLVDILKGLLDKTCRDLVNAEWPKKYTLYPYESLFIYHHLRSS